MEYIIVKDGVIEQHMCSSTLPEGAIQVDFFQGCVGDPVEWYTENWERIPDIELMKSGVRKVPEGMKLQGDKLVPLNLVERIQAGLVECPSGMKVVADQLVEMTQSEKLEAGLITQNDIYNEEIEELKLYLRDTDWIHNKCIEEGLTVSDKYPDLIKSRKEARARINELEALLV